MKRIVTLAFVLIVSLIFPIQGAHAAWLQYQTSPADTFNRADLTPEFDITHVGFGVSDTAPDEYWFFLTFTGEVTATRFADGLDSWAAIFLDTNLDGIDDYSLETSSVAYAGNFFHKGRFEDRTSGSPVLSSLCTVETWTNLDKKASWIGFSLPKTCLPFGSTLGLRGYSDRIPNDSKDYDYAPDTYWNVNLSGGAVTTPGSATSSTITGQLPSQNSLGQSIVTSPASQPTDLVSLAAKTTQSVVTVQCSTGIGSGWSINVTLSAANISNGYKSYIITNHHVIDACTASRNVTLVLSNQTKVSGFVYAWDEANDVAGILTSTVIDPLDWRGPSPQQGWWVGVIGSPLGFPGILTTGIVSSVNASTFMGTTNAAINPGNSGGPVFDHNGRVIGLATAKYLDAEGFGIFNGTPLLCKNIVVCTSTSQIWMGAAAASPTPSPTPSASDQSKELINASNATWQNINSVEALVADCNDSISNLGAAVSALINRTSFGRLCNSYNSKIEEVKKKLKAFNISTSDITGGVNTLNDYSDLLHSYKDSINLITVKLADSFDLFSDIEKRLSSATSAKKDNLKLWTNFNARLKLLPNTLQATIKKQTLYKRALTSIGTQRLFNLGLEKQNSAITVVSTLKELDNFSIALGIFENRYKDFIGLANILEDLEVQIPDYVCKKGSTISLLLKSGKCATGFSKTATFR